MATRESDQARADQLNQDPLIQAILAGDPQALQQVLGVSSPQEIAMALGQIPTGSPTLRPEDIRGVIARKYALQRYGAEGLDQVQFNTAPIPGDPNARFMTNENLRQTPNTFSAKPYTSAWDVAKPLAIAAGGALGAGALINGLAAAGAGAGGSSAGGLGSAGYMGGEVGPGAAPAVAGGGVAGASKLLPYLLKAGGDIGSAIIGHRAIGKASEQQQAATQRAIDLNQQMYNQTAGNLQPYITTGQNSLGRLSAFLGLPAAKLPAGTLGGLK